MGNLHTGALQPLSCSLPLLLGCYCSWWFRCWHWRCHHAACACTDSVSRLYLTLQHGSCCVLLHGRVIPPGGVHQGASASCLNISNHRLYDSVGGCLFRLHARISHLLLVVMWNLVSFDKKHNHSTHHIRVFRRQPYVPGRQQVAVQNSSRTHHLDLLQNNHMRNKDQKQSMRPHRSPVHALRHMCFLGVVYNPQCRSARFPEAANYWMYLLGAPS